METDTLIDKKTAADRSGLFMDLYQRLFPLVAGYVAKWGGTLEEAKDVFHDGLLIYYEKMLDQSLDLMHGERAYIFGVTRHLWIKRYKENQRHASLDQLMGSFENDDDSHLDWTDHIVQEQAGSTNRRILRLLQVAGQKCMEMLTAFYYEKLDMGEVAERFGFSGKRSATAQKFKCLQKVKQVVKEKSLQYEDFVG